MFATNVIYPALASADQFIIGSVMGVASVAHYAVPMGLVVRSAAIPIAFGRTLFPRISSLSGDAAHTLGARALSSLALWLCHHLRSSNHPLADLPAILDQPRFRDGLGPRGASPLPRRVDVLGIDGHFHSPAKPGQGRSDRQTEYHRISAICGHSLGFDHGFRDCRRGRCLDLAQHGGRLGYVLAFRNEEEGASPFAPPAALLVASLVVSRFLGSNIIENFLVASFAGAASITLGCLFSEDWRALILAQMNRTRVFFEQSDRPGQAVAARQHKPAKIAKTSGSARSGAVEHKIDLAQRRGPSHFEPRAKRPPRVSVGGVAGLASRAESVGATAITLTAILDPQAPRKHLLQGLEKPAFLKKPCE